MFSCCILCRFTVFEAVLKRFQPGHLAFGRLTRPLLGYHHFIPQLTLSDEHCTVVKKSLHTSQMADQASAYSGFSSMKRLGIFLHFWMGC